MDWTKAKTILILALLATNIFLIVTYGFVGISKEKEKKDVLIEILENNQITLAVELPETPGKIPLLYVEYSGMSKESLQEVIKRKSYHTPAGNITDATLEETGERFLRENGLLNDSMKFDRIISKGGRKVVEYINESNGMKVETSYIHLFFSQGILVEADIYWLESKEMSQKKKNVISPSEALIRFMAEIQGGEKEKIPVVVHDIELVYWLDDSSFNGEGTTIKDTALPAWKISFGENQAIYIYAYEQ